MFIAYDVDDAVAIADEPKNSTETSKKMNAPTLGEFIFLCKTLFCFVQYPFVQMQLVTPYPCQAGINYQNSNNQVTNM